MNISTAIATLLVVSASTLGQAQDATETPERSMLQTRSELQTQMQAMSEKDRELYQQLNRGTEAGAGNYGKGKGSGEHKRLKVGSGKSTGKMRHEGQQNSNFGSGYGAGYGSRQGVNRR